MSNTSQNDTDTVRTRKSSQRLTDRFVKTLEVPTQGNRISYDNQLPGFGLRVTAKITRYATLIISLTSLTFGLFWRLPIVRMGVHQLTLS
ncbi:MAG: hypothetical protein ABJP66_05855 [Hyphomicrobiales bacterium]